MHLKQLQYHQPHVVSGKKTNIPSIIVFVLCGSTFESRSERTPPRDSEVAPADKTISDCWICSAGWRRKRGKERRKKKLATAADLQTPSSAPWGGLGGGRAMMEAGEEGRGARWKDVRPGFSNPTPIRRCRRAAVSGLNIIRPATHTRWMFMDSPCRWRVARTVGPARRCPPQHVQPRH